MTVAVDVLLLVVCGGKPVSVVDGKRVEDLLPAGRLADEVGAIGPAGVRDEVEHLHRGLLVREMTSVTDRAAKPGVEALDRICRVDDLPQLEGELEERHELLPRVLPTGDHRWGRAPSTPR
jgi:hypothetical protein